MNGEPRKWLIITLAAPFASFGEEAGNVRRGTADRPTRSALLGLAGAALGIDRVDAEGTAGACCLLSRRYSYAVRRNIGDGFSHLPVAAFGQGASPH